MRSISTATSIDQDEDPEEYLPDDYAYEENGEVSPGESVTTPLRTIPEGEEEEEGGKEDVPENGIPGTPETSVRKKWQFMAERSLEANGNTPVEDPIKSTGSVWSRVKMVRISEDQKRPNRLGLEGKKSTNRKPTRTPFLSDGESHMVWRPKKRPQLANLVELLQHQDSETAKPKPQEEPQPTVPTTPKSAVPSNLLTPAPTRQLSLRSRQKTLFNRVIATQAFLKERNNKLLTQTEDKDQEEVAKPRHLTLLEASKKVTANLRKQKSEEESKQNFSDIVTQLLVKPKEVSPEVVEGVASRAGSGSRNKPELKRKETRGAIPLSTLRDLVREEQRQSTVETRYALEEEGLLI